MDVAASEFFLKDKSYDLNFKEEASPDYPIGNLKLETVALLSFTLWGFVGVVLIKLLLCYEICSYLFFFAEQ